jgi:broad specificity phosphatase PhoE
MKDVRELRDMKNSLGQPKNLTFLVSVMSFTLLLLPSIASAQQLVIVVRHAERADGGSMSPNKQPDPLLSAEGEARAKRLASMLAESGITAIYATEYRRTQDTAKPIAEKLGLKVLTHKGQDAAALAAVLKSQHVKDVVLVVGHSNTMPSVIKALGGPAVTVPDSEYDTIYFLVPATGTLSKIRY